MLIGMRWTAYEAYTYFTTKELYRGIFPLNANFTLNGPKYGTGKGI
jgi:hypothetical protein